MRKNLPVTQNEYFLKDDDVLITRTDDKGVITYTNQRFIEVSGFSEDELMGAPHNLLRHPDVHPAIFEDMWRTIQDGHSWRGYVKNRAKNGDFYWVDANITPVRDNGKVVGYASVRVKPDREAVEQAWEIYQQVNQNPTSFIVSRGNIYKTVGIKRFFRMRPWGITSQLSFLSALVVGSVVAGVSVAHLSQKEQKEIVSIQQQQVASIESQLSSIGKPMDDKIRQDIDELHNTLNEMTALMENHSSSDKTTYWMVLSLSLAFLLLSLIMLYRLRRRWQSTMVTAKDAALQVAAGNLFLKLDVDGDNERGDLFKALELMRVGINNIVDDIKSSAQQVQPSIEAIVQGNEAMLSRIENQAAFIQETAAAIEEISSTVKNSEQSAAQASESSGNTVSKVKDGEKIMLSVKASMEDISERSRQMVGLVKTIDAIAFQTNILALNASIEAARAGEHGRGFSVVAQEVRALANRSAQMAKEIQNTIEKTVSSIDDGVDMTTRSQEVMGSILTASEEVRALMQEISSASSEHSNGVTQIEQSILEIDRATQESAAAVSDYSTASDELMKEAERLAKTASAFNIGHGEDASEILRKKKEIKRQRREKAKEKTPNLTSKSSDDDWKEF